MELSLESDQEEYYDMKRKNNNVLYSVIITVSKPVNLKQNGVRNTSRSNAKVTFSVCSAFNVRL
jgi:hypothetical protein